MISSVPRFFIRALGLCLFSWTAFAYPQIKSWQNSPVIAFEDKRTAALTANGILKNPFAAVTKERDELSLKMNNFDHVVIYENSKIQVLEISPETHTVPDLYFLEGRIRLTTDFRGVSKSGNDMVLKTPFFDLPLTTEADFFVDLNLKDAWVEVRVIRGALPLTFFAYEKKVRLTEGQFVRFSGESSDDKKSIKYDYLLDKRKVPRGSLSDVKSFDREQFLKAEDEARSAEVKRKKQLEEKRRAKARQQKAYEDSFLCKKPFGQKDQCIWTIENGKCYRKRCNVSGQWGAVTERPMSANCQLRPTAIACDY